MNTILKIITNCYYVPNFVTYISSFHIIFFQELLRKLSYFRIFSRQIFTTRLDTQVNKVLKAKEGGMRFISDRVEIKQKQKNRKGFS